MNKETIIWQSANAFIEEQTRIQERVYKSSHPKPSNYRMGFSGSDKKAFKRRK